MILVLQIISDSFQFTWMLKDGVQWISRIKVQWHYCARNCHSEVWIFLMNLTQALNSAFLHFSIRPTTIRSHQEGPIPSVSNMQWNNDCNLHAFMKIILNLYNYYETLIPLVMSKYHIQLFTKRKFHMR